MKIQLILVVAVLLIGTALVSIVGITSAGQQSVSLGGHTFTADLPEGWIVSDDPTVTTPEVFDSSNPNISPEGGNVEGVWKGVDMAAFDFLGYPNAPKENKYYGVITGYSIIYVLNIPNELKQSIQAKDIASFGSVDKISDDRKAEDTQTILLNAEYVTKMGDYKFDSDKGITFNDHDARLFEKDDDVSSVGDIAILLDPNTVAVIHVSANKKHISGEDDAKLFDGRAWEVIDSITVK